ncbi:hypothetical protein L1887_49903 [Cichorium endivia]|nr:hypothetical protein L1887_49903 [Cichorium endivia]
MPLHSFFHPTANSRGRSADLPRPSREEKIGPAAAAAGQRRLVASTRRFLIKLGRPISSGRALVSVELEALHLGDCKAQYSPFQPGLCDTMARKRSRNSTAPAPTHEEPQQEQTILGEGSSTLPGSRKKRAPPPPADNELDLEKLIFGGSSSLLSTPAVASRPTGEDAIPNDDQDDDAASQGSQDQALDDGDLFMVDTAGGDDDDDGQLDARAEASGSERDSDDDDDEILIDRPSSSSAAVKKPKRTKRCVWTDPDDAHLTIDLTRGGTMGVNGSRVGNARLRRLRDEVGESKISGLEYEMRLRAQFEKLHPRPGWASFRLGTHTHPDDAADGSDAVVINEDATRGIHDLLRSDTGLVAGLRRCKIGQGTRQVEGGRDRAGSTAQCERCAERAMRVVAEESLPAIEMIDGKTNALVQTIPRAGSAHPARLVPSLGRVGAHRRVEAVPVCLRPAGGTRGALGANGAVLDPCTAGDAASVLGDRGTGIGVTGTGKDVELLTMSVEGSVHLWDIRNTGMQVGCTSIWTDPGLVWRQGPRGVAQRQVLSVGSESGIVNIYKRPAESYADAASSSGSPRPTLWMAGRCSARCPVVAWSRSRAVENLVTATSTMRWNGDGTDPGAGVQDQEGCAEIGALPNDARV